MKMFKNFYCKRLMCFYLSIFLVNNTIFCKDYCCECCKVCCCWEDDNEESKNKNYEGNKNILIQTIEKYSHESEYSYIYKMMQIAIKDIKVKFNFDVYENINKIIQEQENSGKPSLIILFEKFCSLMNTFKMFQKKHFNGKVVELLNLLLVECSNINDETKDQIPEDKQQLEEKKKSLKEIIDKNINFINFSEKNINNLYSNIRNSLQAIYEKKYLYIVNFQIESLIEYINKNCELLNKGLKEEENNEKKLTDLSQAFDQKFFNDLNFNNKVVKTTPIKKEGESCFYRKQKVRINDIEYQQMIIPGDGNCLLYSIFAYFDYFACRKEGVEPFEEEFEQFELYTATEECEENANILRENLLTSTFTYIDYVFEQIKKESTQQKKEDLNIILFCLNNIGNDLSVPKRDIDINCLMIIAKYFGVDICLYIKTQESFLYFDKQGSLPKSIIGQDFNQKDGIKLIMINNNHYELLRKSV